MSEGLSNCPLLPLKEHPAIPYPRVVLLVWCIPESLPTNPKFQQLQLCRLALARRNTSVPRPEAILSGSELNCPTQDKVTYPMLGQSPELDLKSYNLPEHCSTKIIWLCKTSASLLFPPMWNPEALFIYRRHWSLLLPTQAMLNKFFSSFIVILLSHWTVKVAGS